MRERKRLEDDVVFYDLQQLVSNARDKKPRGRYAKLDEEMERGNQDFIEQQKNQQQVCVCEGGRQVGPQRLCDKSEPMKCVVFQ